MGSVRGTVARLALGALLVSGAAALGGCGQDKMCCTYPEPVDAAVPLTWTVAGQAAAAGCAAAGASQVAVEIQGWAQQPAAQPAQRCGDGGATFQATLPGATALGPWAGSVTAHLLAADGAELSARRIGLLWEDRKVSAEIPFVLASPGGAIRFRWCHALPTASSVTFDLDGPMWRSVTEAAPVEERLVGGLAAGRYQLSSSQTGQSGTSFGWREVEVVNGAELLVKGGSCTYD